MSMLIHSSGAGPWPSTRVPVAYRRRSGSRPVDPPGGDMAAVPAEWLAECGLSEYVPPETPAEPVTPLELTDSERQYWELSKSLGSDRALTGEEIAAIIQTFPDDDMGIAERLALQSLMLTFGALQEQMGHGVVTTLNAKLEQGAQ